jgi:hypothetical protein
MAATASTAAPTSGSPKVSVSLALEYRYAGCQ